ncbi:MAG: hypothetical protein AB7P40_05075 [Chloroflexota bacterium]
MIGSQTRVAPWVTWSGIVLILISGAIHFITTPGHFDYATYLGWLFILQGVGSLVAAYGIFRGDSWGWTLGFIMAGVAFVAYVWSRLFGLPGMPASEVEWLDPFGVIAKIAEVAFIAVYAYAMTMRAPDRVHAHS